MSIPAMAWAKRQRTGNVGRKVVLLVLADYATFIEDWDPCDGRHYAWPGEARLADECELTDRSVRTHLAALEDAGLIRRISRPGSGEGRKTDLIILAVDSDGPRPFVDNPVDASVDDDVDKGNRKNLPDGATGNSQQGNRKNDADAPYIEPPSEHPSSSRPEVIELCELLADLIVANGSRKPSITKQWHDAARLLLDRDGFSVEQVRWIINWSQRDQFWRTNILSMPTLRRQFDKLKLRALEEHQRRQPAALKFPTAQERSQQQRDEWAALAKEADAWITANGGDPEDHKLVLEVMERIKAQRANGSATRTPGMYIDGDVIDGEVAKPREVTAGEGL